ncbi:Hypothetical predicted protein [Paramuricea clavata]|uniref:Uncharacterized protein n=1 Tax=Paramuricea clavata TaxID=317549 RepID=A0A6S7GVH8_PARCT|nr:Hypothetical predicted protein [Paramuricea clavata]
MENHGNKEKPCVACEETHPIWQCLIFKAWSGDKKWEIAKRAGLCCRCLGDNHLGKDLPNPKPPIQDPPPAMEGDAGDKTTMETVDKHEGKSVALRIVPIILKNDKKRLLVNCFLHEGSDTTYVNEDVIEQLGLQEEKEPVTIQFANAQQVTFMSAIVEIGIESVDGKVDSVIVAKTS